MADEQFDVVLSNGIKANIDKSALTIGEWRRFWNVATPDTETDAILAKVSGLSAKEIKELLYDDFRRLVE